MSLRSSLTPSQRNKFRSIYCKAKDNNLRNVLNKDQAEKLCNLYKVSLSGFELYPDNTASLTKLSYHIAKNL